MSGTRRDCLSQNNSSSSSGSKLGHSCLFRIVAQPRTGKQSHCYVLQKGGQRSGGKTDYCLSIKSQTWFSNNQQGL